MEDPATALLPDRVEELARALEITRIEVVGLREEVARLRRENSELRTEVGFRKRLHAQARERVDQLQKRVEELEAENRQLRQQAFGRKAEKLCGDMNALKELDDATASSGQSKRRKGQQANRPGPKRRNYEHLPQQVEIVELPPEQRCCAACGQPYAQRAETEDSEQLEIEVRAYRRLIRRRRYQPQCRCRGPWNIVTAPPPPKLIPKSRLGISIWVEILLDKFASQRPLERLLEQWRLVGLDVAAGTVTGGLRQLAPLFEPLYEALRARQQQGDFWQSDDTRWQVFEEQEGKIGHQWWLWVFLSDDTVVFVLDHRHSRHVPQGHLPTGLGNGKKQGVMMVDRASAYKAMAQVKDDEIALAFCWAHVRRDFIRVAKSWPNLKEWVIAWLLRIRDLYRRERQRRVAHTQAPPEQAESASNAQQAVAEHVEQMHQQAVGELAESSLREPCRKVLTSLLEHWSGLTRFVQDARIPLDNNASERQLRGPVVGRKNYYGSGAIWSGQLAAMLFSLFATLDRCQVNMRTWLTTYLHACAAAGGRPPPDWSAWLPWTYASPRPAPC